MMRSSVQDRIPFPQEIADTLLALSRETGVHIVLSLTWRDMHPARMMSWGELKQQLQNRVYRKDSRFHLPYFVFYETTTQETPDHYFMFVHPGKLRDLQAHDIITIDYADVSELDRPRPLQYLDASVWDIIYRRDTAPSEQARVSTCLAAHHYHADLESDRLSKPLLHFLEGRCFLTHSVSALVALCLAPRYLEQYLLTVKPAWNLAEWAAVIERQLVVNPSGLIPEVWVNYQTWYMNQFEKDFELLKSLVDLLMVSHTDVYPAYPVFAKYAANDYHAYDSVWIPEMMAQFTVCIQVVRQNALLFGYEKELLALWDKFQQKIVLDRHFCMLWELRTQFQYQTTLLALRKKYQQKEFSLQQRKVRMHSFQNGAETPHAVERIVQDTPLPAQFRGLNKCATHLPKEAIFTLSKAKKPQFSLGEIAQLDESLRALAHFILKYNMPFRQSVFDAHRSEMGDAFTSVSFEKCRIWLLALFSRAFVAVPTPERDACLYQLLSHNAVLPPVSIALPIPRHPESRVESYVAWCDAMRATQPFVSQKRVHIIPLEESLAIPKMAAWMCSAFRRSDLAFLLWNSVQSGAELQRIQLWDQLFFYGLTKIFAEAAVEWFDFLKKEAVFSETKYEGPGMYYFYGKKVNRRAAPVFSDCLKHLTHILESRAVNPMPLRLQHAHRMLKYVAMEWRLFVEKGLLTEEEAARLAGNFETHCQALEDTTHQIVEKKYNVILDPDYIDQWQQWQKATREFIWELRTRRASSDESGQPMYEIHLGSFLELPTEVPTIRAFSRLMGMMQVWATVLMFFQKSRQDSQYYALPAFQQVWLVHLALLIQDYLGLVCDWPCDTILLEELRQFKKTYGHFPQWKISLQAVELCPEDRALMHERANQLAFVPCWCVWFAGSNQERLSLTERTSWERDLAESKRQFP